MFLRFLLLFSVNLMLLFSMSIIVLERKKITSDWFASIVIPLSKNRVPLDECTLPYRYKRIMIAFGNSARSLDIA